MFKEDPKLYSKICGCELAGAIGNALGDKVEGKSWEYVEKTYGLLDRFVEGTEVDSYKRNPDTYDQYRFGHKRAPGSTEDGFERHKLCATAVIRKGGHINAADLAQTFVRQIDSTRFGYLLGWQDQFVYYSIRAGMKAKELGEFASWPGKIGTTKMIMPIGMINAGNPEKAYKEAVRCARIKDAPGNPENHGVEVAGVVAAAVAEALKPDATWESVINVALYYCSERLKAICVKMLDAAKSVKDWRDLRPFYTDMFEGKNESMADEILSAGLAVLYLSKGNPREAVIIASNIGRDTDCKAYVGAGLAGALAGIEAIPADWIKMVEDDVAGNTMTLSRRTSMESARAFYNIVMNDRNGVKEETDTSIFSVIREKLGKAEGAPLTQQDLEGMVSLDAGNKGLKSIKGIEMLTNLTWLKLDNNKICDLSPLCGLVKLEHLDLGLNQITDISALRGLKDLKTLMLYDNKITDISPLKALTKMRYLNLANNLINDVGALSGYTELHALLLENNMVRDISPVKNNTEIYSLSFDNNQVTDISVAAGFTKMIAFYASGNKINDISALSGLSDRLKTVNLNDNRISDGAPLGSLNRLIHLTISRNTIKDMDFIEKLECLCYLEIDGLGASSVKLPSAYLKHLSAADNQLSDISFVNSLKGLHYLNLSNNKISDVKGVSGLSKLKYLYLGGNQIKDAGELDKLKLLEEKTI